MKYGVLGGGNTGQAIAGYLKLNGEDVKLYTSNEERAAKINEGGLDVSGVYSGNAKLKAYTYIDDVVKDAEILIIATTADGHKPILKKIKPLLEYGQVLLFIPGYWGAIESSQILGKDIEEKELVIAETSAQPFISNADDEGSVTVRKIKKNVLVSTLFTSKGQPKLPNELLDRFPHLIQSENIFETSLNNSNVVVHAPISVFNASRIDAAKAFQFYPEGVSPLTSKFVEKLDAERIAVANLFNVDAKPILSILNEFYGTNYPSLLEALPGLFPEGAGPNTIDHRYFTEDIPFGLVPISEMAKKVNVSTPYTDSLIETASLFGEVDYRNIGVNLEETSIDEIFEYGGMEQ